VFLFCELHHARPECKQSSEELSELYKCTVLADSIA
jgi:hypothetical protein